MLVLLGIYLGWTGAKGEDVFNGVFPGPDLAPGDYVRWLMTFLGLVIVGVAVWHPVSDFVLDRFPSPPNADYTGQLNGQLAETPPGLPSEAPDLLVEVDRKPLWTNFQHEADIVELHVAITNQTDSDKTLDGFTWTFDSGGITWDIEVMREVERLERRRPQLQRHAIIEAGATETGWLVRAFPRAPESLPKFRLFVRDTERKEYEAVGYGIGARRTNMVGKDVGRISADSNVLVGYIESTNSSLGIRFLFPNEPDTSGPVVLAPGHGRPVLWHIELINHLETDIPNIRFNILLPAALMKSLVPVTENLKYSVHDVPERLIHDDQGKGSLCLSGSYGPLPGRGWATVLAFTIGIHYARDLPVKVKLDSDETGRVEYCAPIVGVVAPIRGVS